MWAMPFEGRDAIIWKVASGRWPNSCCTKTLPDDVMA
jgi:hypothetical protein